MSETGSFNTGSMLNQSTSQKIITFSTVVFKEPPKVNIYKGGNADITVSASSITTTSFVAIYSKGTGDISNSATITWSASGKGQKL